MSTCQACQDAANVCETQYDKLPSELSDIDAGYECGVEDCAAAILAACTHTTIPEPTR